MLGLVQVGDQADRYAYLPIGLYLALAFGRRALRGREELSRPPRWPAAAAGALAVVTVSALPHWQDSRTLFERALAHGNWIADNNFGLVYRAARDGARARALQAAMRERPSFVQARFGQALEADGDYPKAIETLLRRAQVR